MKNTKKISKNSSSDSKTQDDKLLQLSVSSVEAFQSCRAKWYYRYILKLPSTKNYHTTSGSFIHKVLEVFLQQLKKHRDFQKASKVALAIAKKDPELSDTLTSNIIEEGEKWLQRLIEKFTNDPNLIPNVLKIETPFSFKIEEEKILVRGFIDRIDQPNDSTLQIIDYKTSSNPSYLKPFQLITYVIATKKVYPDKQIRAAYELIRHDFQRQEYSISESDESHALATFKQVAQDIRQLKVEKPNEVWEANPTKLCDYCPYRVRCEVDRSKKTPWKV